jgi:acyl CoA:acetate/3-ketoacid CoA transferase beta subunit
MGAVQRIYTNLAVLDVVAGRGFVVREIVPGCRSPSSRRRPAHAADDA